MPGQVELAGNFRQKQADDVRCRGDAVTRPQFLGDTGTTGQRATFHHQDAAPGFREAGRGDEAVVSGSNDNAVVHAGEIHPREVPGLSVGPSWLSGSSMERATQLPQAGCTRAASHG